MQLITLVGVCKEERHIKKSSVLNNFLCVMEYGTGGSGHVLKLNLKAKKDENMQGRLTW